MNSRNPMMLVRKAWRPQLGSSRPHGAYRLSMALALVFSLCACREQQKAVDSSEPQAMKDAMPATKIVARSSPVEIAAAGMKLMPESSESCSLDSIDGEFFSGAHEAGHSDAPILNGWVSDQARAQAGKFEIVLASADKAFSFAAGTGQARPDVARHFKAPGLAESGFETSIDISQVPSGRYSVVYVIRDNAATARCETGKSIAID